jgi:phospholipid/cholesterol/gamma-HCH transport system substrate-binding protein
LRIPRAGLIALIASVAIAAVLFAYLLARFGGPTVRFGEPYRVTVKFPDSEGLSSRSEVLVRGVSVGEVDSIELEGDTAVATLALDDGYAPLREGTTVRVGEKTLFGEAYVDLDPAPRGAEIADGATLARTAVLPAATDVDQALSAFDRPGRDDLTALIRTFARGESSPRAADQISLTTAQLERVTAELRTLTGELSGQESQIAAGVRDAHAVVAALAEHGGAIRSIVDDGRATLAALASRSDAIRAGISRLPGTVERARSTLAGLRPLLAEARPVAADLADAAAPLRRVLERLPAVAGDADRLLAALPGLERVALPFLDRTATVLRMARPVVGPFGDALRNLQPIAKYLADRRDTFAAWFSNTGDLGSSRDAKGYFARFFVGFDPTTALGIPGGNFKNNSYTQPHDALDNQPYSGYPRLEPYDPGP